MNSRRIWFAIAAIALGLAASPAPAQDKYPSRPIKIIVPTPAGGPVDVVARVVANYLTTTLGQSVIVDNRPGAGNTIGSKEAARAEPDGYTLLYSAVSGLILAPMLQKDAGYDPLTSFAPVVAVGSGYLILVVHPSVPAKSVQELVTYAKANPGKINFSSGGIGVLPHLTGEMFKAAAGINIVHVPYRGGAPALTDLIGGQVQVMLETSAGAIEYVRTGKLRALAVTTSARSEALPDIPTVSEFVPGYESSGFFGIFAPGKTPSVIVDKLNKEINAGLADPKLKAQLADLGGMILVGSPADFRSLIAEETEKWAKVIRAANIKL